MPPHSSHLLQPLDIGCFAVLKRSYSRLVKSKMRARINHIDKLDFLEAYPLARIEAFQSETIINSFRAAGLVPFFYRREWSQSLIFGFEPLPPFLAGVVIGIQKRPRTIYNCKNKLRQLKYCFVRDKEGPPPEPAQFRYKPDFKSLPDHDAIRRITGERSKPFTRWKREEKAKANSICKDDSHEGDLSVQEVRELRSELYKA